jgi:hypothetical protein
LPFGSVEQSLPIELCTPALMLPEMVVSSSDFVPFFLCRAPFAMIATPSMSCSARTEPAVSASGTTKWQKTLTYHSLFKSCFNQARTKRSLEELSKYLLAPGHTWPLLRPVHLPEGTSFEVHVSALFVALQSV